MEASSLGSMDERVELRCGKYLIGFCQGIHERRHFSHAKVMHGFSTYNNHATLHGSTIHAQRYYRHKKLLRFDSHWLREEDCEGGEMPQVVEWSRGISVALQDWDKKKFKDLSSKINRLQRNYKT